jgi:hypothetical protein
MARPQVADGGTASNMENACAYILQKSPGQPKRVGLPAWGLGEVLITPHCKIVSCYESFTQEASDLE